MAFTEPAIIERTVQNRPIVHVATRSAALELRTTIGTIDLFNVGSADLAASMIELLENSGEHVLPSPPDWLPDGSTYAQMTGAIADYFVVRFDEHDGSRCVIALSCGSECRLYWLSVEQCEELMDQLWHAWIAVDR